MRDLYSRLGIEPKASEQEIQKAIASCGNAALSEDANTVLLVPSRRQNYDRVHATLRDVGALRAHLGLNHSDNWKTPESNDFTTDPAHGLSMYDELLEKILRLNKKAKMERAIESVKKFFYGIFRFVTVLGGLAFVFWMISASEETSKPSSTTSRPYPSPQQSAFSEPALPLPTSGTIRRYTGAEGVAPLEIKTSSGSNYLVKLEDMSTGNNILDVFVRGGSTVNIQVPLGTYRLKYAAGQTWYGYEHYFGPSTGYSKADSAFRFYNDGYRLSGYTVTLYQVQNGNLSTSRLSPNQF